VRQARNAYAVDVNNDGVHDIVQDTIQLPNQVNIRVANGDGTFHNGFSYTFPFQYQSTTLMASGDLNGDGKVDLVFGMAGFPQIAVVLGNGDGTFQNPRYQTVPSPPASGSADRPSSSQTSIMTASSISPPRRILLPSVSSSCSRATATAPSALLI
jgi:hypothetical protein